MSDPARRAVGSAAVIADESRSVLLLRRSYPPHDWVLPGGVAEPMESPVDTVIREVREETGLRVRPTELLAVLYQPDQVRGGFLHFIFRCAVDGALDVRPDASEVAEHRFYASDELPRPMSVSTAHALRYAFAGERPALPITIRSAPAGRTP